MHAATSIGGRGDALARYLLLAGVLASVAGSFVNVVAAPAAPAVFVAVLALGGWRANRAGVDVDDDGVRVRGFWRDVSHPWAEVRGFGWSRPGEGGVTGIVPVGARLSMSLRGGNDRLLPVWGAPSTSNRIEAPLRLVASRHGVPVEELRAPPR